MTTCAQRAAAGSVAERWNTRRGARLLVCVLLSTGCADELPTASQVSGDSGQRFGEAVSGAGDVNGDGFADVVVGAPGLGGAAFVFHGAPHGLDTTPAATLHQPEHGDTLDWGRFGWAVSAAGDVDGDGFDDVIVGTPTPWTEPGVATPSFQGRAYVFHGSAAGLDAAPTTTLLPPDGHEGERFGDSVAPAGDVNGDGYDDVVVGATLWSSDVQTESGRAAYVFHGTSSALEPTPAVVLDGGGIQAEGWCAGAVLFGSMVGAGDVDGDGFHDVIVGSVGDGTAALYRGSASSLDPDPAVTFPVTEWLSHTIAAAGDVDGDGFDDLIVGDHLTPTDDEHEPNGAAFTLGGSSAGLDTAPRTTLYGQHRNAGFGCAVSTAGDFDGDGFDDVVASALYWPEGGAAYVFRGTSDGLDPSPTATLRGDSGVDYFGYLLSAAGDVNGDGLDDVVVSAQTRDASGVVHVFLGDADR